MGGAFNVDRPQHHYGADLYNYPSKEDIDYFANNVNGMDGVDLMVTHSCPHSIGVGIVGDPFFIPGVNAFIKDNGFTVGPLSDCGDSFLTDLWNQLTVKPKNWIFGHMHQHKHTLVGDTNFYCVGTADNHYGNPAVYFYDTELKQVLK
jgi:hypothetical protein